MCCRCCCWPYWKGLVHWYHTGLSDIEATTLLAAMEEVVDHTQDCVGKKGSVGRPWKRNASRVIISFEWTQKWSGHASYYDGRDHFRNHLNHPEVTLRPSMPCPGTFESFEPWGVTPAGKGHVKRCREGCFCWKHLRFRMWFVHTVIPCDTWWIWTMLTTYMYIVGDCLALLYHEDDE